MVGITFYPLPQRWHILFQSWGLFGFLFYMFSTSSSRLLLFHRPQGRGEICFTAPMHPVVELELKQTGQWALWPGVPPAQPYSG